MRVHGDVYPKRRANVPEKKNYKNYLAFLEEDFSCHCGYCGKSQKVARHGFEIDHFVPKKIDPAREIDYQNLVYSCYTCNRTKASKWPTEDKDCPNDGQVGFVDPTSEEYDHHLTRQDDGMIVGITQLGTYMSEECFKFSIRPMREIWKLMQMLEKRDLLKAKKNTMTSESKDEYIALTEAIEELYDLMFEKRE